MAVCILNAVKGDKIIDLQTHLIGTVIKVSQIGNYDILKVKFEDGIQTIVPMDDAQTLGRYQFANLNEKELSDAEAAYKENLR